MSKLLFVFSICFCIGLAVFTDSANGQTCTPPPIKFNTTSEIIFTPEQEMYLGEAILERVRSDYGVIDDPAVTAHLQKIVERLSQHLPDKGIKFRIMISDAPYPNAFAFPGGVIMVTRKMISFARTEDELAWVIAHELGHGTVRHGAIDFSKYFRSILNVSSFRDRDDVIEKYHELLDQWNTKNVSTSESHENEQQGEADKLGVFALVASGYDANQIPGFWSRLTQAKKKSSLAMIFGGSTLADKRLKEILDQYKNLPRECLSPRPLAENKEFNEWRTKVITYDNYAKTESVPGVLTRSELVPLRSEIEWIRFSGNGEYLITQDTSTITVLSRVPLKVLFQVPADDARPAEFSSDSSELIIVTKGLHVQRWNVANQKLVADDEIVITGSYWQTKVSLNGDYVAAYKYDGDLVINDIRSGSEVYRKKGFYIPRSFEYFMWRFAKELNDGDEVTIFSMKFSPDGKYFLAGRSSDTVFGTNGESIVLDLATRKPLDIGDNIKRLIKNGFTFISSDMLVGRTGDDIKNSGIFTFPGGERKDQFELGGMVFNKSSTGDTVAVRPVNGAAVGVYDLKQKKYVFAGRRSALDVYQNLVAAERKNGELAIYKLGMNDPEASIELPKSDFGTLRTVSFSDDGKFVAASNRSRGAVWSLGSGERLFHLRGFRGSFFGDGNAVYADFPASGDMKRNIAMMNVSTGSVTPVTSFEEGNARQHGRFLLIRRSLKESDDKEEEKGTLYSEEIREKLVDRNKTEFEIRDVTTGAKLWTRQFLQETPTYYVNSSNDNIAFVWRAEAKAVSELVKQRSELAARYADLSDRPLDYFVQFVDAATGVPKAHFFLETGKRSFSMEHVALVGDYIVVNDSENRILVYSAGDGKLIRRFIGFRSVLHPEKKIIAVENVAGRLTFYDIASGNELRRASFRRNISSMKFSRDGGRMYVLTTDQIAYVIDTTNFTRP